MSTSSDCHWVPHRSVDGGVNQAFRMARTDSRTRIEAPVRAAPTNAVRPRVKETGKWKFTRTRSTSWRGCTTMRGSGGRETHRSPPSSSKHDPRNETGRVGRSTRWMVCAGSLAGDPSPLSGGRPCPTRSRRGDHRWTGESFSAPASGRALRSRSASTARLPRKRRSSPRPTSATAWTARSSLLRSLRSRAYSDPRPAEGAARDSAVAAWPFRSPTAALVGLR
jgi:hypothetical protein